VTKGKWKRRAYTAATVTGIIEDIDTGTPASCQAASIKSAVVIIITGARGVCIRFGRALADAFLALLSGSTLVEAGTAGDLVAQEEVANAWITTTFF